ncbi:cyclin Q [Rhipicephalus microplus]|uniref:Cyclin-Q n=1 Tax=Rhipicephalus microplus TaxID=6941 RepID=A0A6M2CPB9_RHIMP
MAAQKPPTYVGSVRMLFEAGTKLEAKPQTIATAATYFHRFFQECSPDDYDFYLVAATAMYLAGKVEEDSLKIRDVVNVFHKCSFPLSDPLPLGEEYWCLRDSIVQTELLMLRVLEFRLSVDHPHRYLLHYLRSLNDWLGPLTCGGGGGARSGPPCQIPLAQVAWSLLCDMYLQPSCLCYPPQELAVAVIQVALLAYDVRVPHGEDGVLSWYETFCENLSREKLADLVMDVIQVYDGEGQQ